MPKRTEHVADHEDDFRLADKRVGANHVGIALVELPIASFLRPVCAPYRLDLVAFEGEADIVAVHDHKSRKWHG